MEFKYIFGPVRSTRLGISLGVDMLGDNICSFDCIYCECGATTTLTMERREYAPANHILEEIKTWLKTTSLKPNYITLGGLGEPTLNNSLGEIVRGIKSITKIPVAILTNSSLLWQDEVRKELSPIDVILPSMDSLVDEEFKRINRPVKGTSLSLIKEGLLRLREEYRGKIFLEVLLCKGINDSEKNLERLRNFISILRPERVDIVTLSRPGTLALAQPVDSYVLQRWRNILGIQPGKTTHKQECSSSLKTIPLSHLQQVVLSSLRRRPQTREDISNALGIPLSKIKHILLELIKLKKIEKKLLQDQEYFFVPEKKPPES